ncbi:MAG: 50S ribosomal protein L19e [Candidatus Micrarchaeota archaeon]|nr:50S ribosomal protein L19e [Candidatus Micrarchaeota archaeon]
MSVRLTKRIASELLGRGTSNVRIKPDSIKEAEKAITREDVRALVKSGGIYVIKKKHNISAYSKVLNEKRRKGRRRGMGRRKGTKSARGILEYKKKVRGQRRMLKALKGEKLIENERFKKYYALVKGGNFASKASLLSHIRNEGLEISEDKAKELRHV